MDMAAIDWRPAAVFVQAGPSLRGSNVLGVGARWPQDWQALDGRLGLALELSANAWSARREAGGRHGFLQLTAVPVFRWRADAAGSPWFLEAGIGVSYHPRNYVVKSSRQETRWNFNDVLGIGRSFGPHEAALRLSHFSNAGLSKPNPGDTSVSLRWSWRY